MDIEYLDIYDANFNHIGTEDRNKVHERGLWHQTIHCWIIRPNGKIVVQMRGANILSHPNTLDISAAGHLRAGEKLKDCVREVKEEIGIDIEFDALTYLGYFRRTSDSVRDGQPNHNREFTHVFFVKDETPLREYQLQKDEVDGIYEMDIDKALALFFGETPGRFLLEIKPENENRILELLGEVDHAIIGQTTDNSQLIIDEKEYNLSTLEKQWKEAIEKHMVI